MKGSKILSQIGVIFVTCLLIFLYSQIVFAANYYVSPSGSGSTCSKESPCAPSGVPWSTVDDEESTVYLMGGTYTTSLDVIHTTASNRLYIKPCSASPDSTGCNGLVLFKLDATGDTVIWMGSATNTTIDGSKTSVDHTRNIKLDIGNNYGIAYNTGRSGNVIQYVEFTGMNGSGKYCIDAALQTSFETAYNYFHDNIGTAEMNVSGATASTYGAVKIHHNTVTAPTVNVVTGGGRGVDIYNNSFDLTDAAQTYDTIHILNNGIQYLRIYNNEFINNGELEDQTIFLENSTATGNKTQHVRIYNNVFRNSPTNTGGHCSIGIAIENADSAGGVDDFFILNNSFISTTGYFYPVRMYGSSSHMATYTNFKVENNIFKGAAKHILNEYVTWANEADAINDYNIFYHNTANHFAWLDGGGGSITTYTTVCASGCTWASNHPDYLHNKDMDPSYTSTSDLTLQVESPAINTGKDLSAYTDMDASWPADKDGNPRSGAWDIGAYQYGATNKSTLVVTSVNGTVASNPSGINCGSTCSADYESGTSVTLTASPNSGYTFAGWLGGGCSGTGTCTVTMNEATFVTANYTIPVYNLTVAKSGTGTGTVTGSDGLINCGSTCSVNYESGKSVTLTAVTGSGSIFSGWSGACTGTGTCTVSMTAAKSVTATFIPVYTLTVAKSVAAAGAVTSSDGKINCGSTCAATYYPSTSVTLTVSPNSGYTFTGWSGGGCSGTGTCTVTMNAAASVTAYFATTVYNLTVTKSGTGTGTVTGSDGLINCGSTCSVNYESGKSVTLTAVAGSGSIFSGWSGACTGTGTCTVSMTSAKTVTATFTTSVLYKLTVRKSISKAGTITANDGGINCGSTCSANYGSGKSVTLTASANSGYKFYKWAGACTGTGTCTVKMTAAKNATAYYLLSW